MEMSAPEITLRTTSTPSPEPREETPPRTFPKFAELPREMRKMIWRFYFDPTASRIHVIHEVPSHLTREQLDWLSPVDSSLQHLLLLVNKDGRLLQSTTLDADTNVPLRHPVTSCINREAYSEARLLGWKPSHRCLLPPLSARLRVGGDGDALGLDRDLGRLEGDLTGVADTDWD
ncbi:hypothetical protein F5X99DRAFT_411033 [Biscogniauxia marginata]|nr:hypothetical protein F5X99DRAFT_411033 [Biscogniauxia marginata]